MGIFFGSLKTEYEVGSMVWRRFNRMDRHFQRTWMVWNNKKASPYWDLCLQMMRGEIVVMDVNYPPLEPVGTLMRTQYKRLLEIQELLGYDVRRHAAEKAGSSAHNMVFIKRSIDPERMNQYMRLRWGGVLDLQDDDEVGADDDYGDDDE